MAGWSRQLSLAEAGVNKTNEMLIFAELLDHIDLTKVAVTADAMHASVRTPSSWWISVARIRCSP